MQLENLKTTLLSHLSANQLIRLYLLLLVTVLYTIILFPNFIVPQYSYQLGDIVRRNIKTPSDFFIEDRDATEKNRKQAGVDVLTVYDHDKNLHVRLAENVRQSFAMMRDIIETAEQSGLSPTVEAENEPVEMVATRPPEILEKQNAPYRTSDVADVDLKTILHQKIWEKKDDSPRQSVLR